MALPASRFTQTQLLDYVRGDLGLRSSNLLTDTDIIQWAIRASDIISRETLFKKSSGLVNSTASTKEYDLPSGCLAIEEVLYSTSGTAGTHLPLQPVAISDLMSRDPYWRSEASGTPILYYVRGATSYGLHPTPGTSVTNGIQVIYAALATPAAAAGDTYEVPFGNGEAILSYCKYQASLKDISGEGRLRAEEYKRRWLSDLEELKQAVTDLDEAGACVVGADSSPYGRSRVWGWIDSPASEAP